MRIEIISIFILLVFIYLKIAIQKYSKIEKIFETISQNRVTKEDKNYSIKGNIIDTSKSKYTYETMIKDLDLLSKKYKEKMHINILGITYDNRNIYEIIIGNIHSKKHILIHAGIHGREYLNSLMLIKQIEYYLDSYETNEYNGISYRELFENITFHIVPMVNPDGITISQIGINGIRNSDLKECINKCYQEDIRDKYTNDNYESYLKKWKANARGVDLNRNFNASWDLLNQSPHPSFENYKGKCYESELETRALVGLTNMYNFVLTISYHSSGNIIYWDYIDSLTKNECSNLADITNKCTKYEKAMSDFNYNEVVSGGYKDWASSKNQNPIPSITIETGEGNCPLNIKEFNNLWESNRGLWAIYAYELSKDKRNI